MTRIRRICLKDAAHLWPQILLFWAALVVSAFADPLGDPQIRAQQFLLPMLQPLACWLLVVSAIQAERLTGHEAYWLTRPFSWKDLWAAKASFVIATVNLPLLVVQCVTLSSVGISPIDWLPALLWRQVFFTILYLLPAAAVASVTRNLGQALLAGILMAAAGWAVAALLIIPEYPTWGALDWIRDCGVALVVAIGASAVLWMQYARRMTVVSRGVLGAVLVLAVATAFAPRWAGATAIQRLVRTEHVSDSQVRLSLDQSRAEERPHRWGSGSSDPKGERLFLPVRISDMPEGAALAVDWHEVHVKGPRGEWRSGWLTTMEGSPLQRGLGWLTVFVDPAYYQASADVPVDLDATFELTLFRREREQSIPLERRVVVPEIGVCRFSYGSGNGCYSPFQQVQINLATGSPTGESQLVLPNGSYGPFPTTSEFRPMEVTRHWSSPQTPGSVMLVMDRPVAHVERRMETRGIRMREFHKPEAP